VTVTRVDQGMAAAAARALEPVTVNKELRTRYRQLRVMLHSAGLAATYAFIASKAGGGDGESAGLAGAYRAAATGIRTQLADTGLLPDAENMTVRDVMRELGAMDPVRYARASAEAAAFAGWLSRLADAVWQEGDGGA
jgi:CRISPR/Cas system CMR-associated protein Cmr5 small subunit